MGNTPDIGKTKLRYLEWIFLNLCLYGAFFVFFGPITSLFGQRYSQVRLSRYYFVVTNFLASCYLVFLAQKFEAVTVDALVWFWVVSPPAFPVAGSLLMLLKLFSYFSKPKTLKEQLADAENLPFDDGAFDAVVSTFGVMFTPNQKQAAAELLRVCRSGGRIGLANWTPDSFIGALFKTLGGHIAPPPGVQSPALWGNRAWIDETFGPQAASTRFELKAFSFRYRSAAHFVHFFRTYYGPTHKAFLALDEAGQKALEADIVDLIGRYNVATDGAMVVPGEYAEIVIEKA